MQECLVPRHYNSISSQHVLTQTPREISAPASANCLAMAHPNPCIDIDDSYLHCMREQENVTAAKSACLIVCNPGDEGLLACSDTSGQTPIALPLAWWSLVSRVERTSEVYCQSRWCLACTIASLGPCGCKVTPREASATSRRCDLSVC